MNELLTAAQMRAVEQAAIASTRVTGRALMERAGGGAAAAILRRWPGQGTAVVLAGPGNNGGDGYVIARHLREAGWAVEVVADAPPATPDAAAACAEWGGTPRPSAWLDEGALAPRPVVVDAQFGTGLARPVARPVWAALALAQARGCPLVAVDILSGLCSDSGRVLAEGYIDRPADLTVTFERMRPGHHLDRGGLLSGEVAVVPIGLEDELAALLRQQGNAVARLVGPLDVGKHGGHKYDHGHALILAGPATRGGAARMAARAALRVGAGLVTLGAPADALAENAARLDAVMLREVDGGDQLLAVLQDRRISAVLMGPGLGRDRAPGLRAAARQARGLVLDADAIDAELGPLPGRCVLTPHGGEFARLCPDLAAQLEGLPQRGPAFSRLDAARQAAARLGAVLLLKGPDTVIAAPDGRAAIHSARGDRAAPWLATAGAGDVLAGLITGLLARGLPPFDAAAAAAWLHVEAALRVGPGLIAEDLPEALPAVLRDLGA